MQETIKNLTKAFIGESQARNRYTLYAKVAKQEGYEQIAEIFLVTADNEKEHAKWLMRLINELKKKYTVIIVTHNMQQAARVSDYTGFMYLGELIEFDDTDQIFENPKEKLTEKYITGRFG